MPVRDRLRKACRAGDPGPADRPKRSQGSSRPDV